MYVPNFLIVMYVPFSVFCVLFVCKCVLSYCHRVSTQLQLNIYHIYHLIWQAYHHNYWTPQPMPFLHGDAAVALHVEAPPPVHIPGDKEVFCLSSISDPSAEDDFSPELMTGWRTRLPKFQQSQ
jgi:hypothetical protein